MQKESSHSVISSPLVDLLTDQQLRAVVRVAECGLGSSLEDINSLMVEAVVGLLSPDFCGVWRAYEGDERNLSLVSWQGAEGIVQPFTSQVASAGSQSQYALYSESAVIIDDLRTEDRFFPSRILSGMGLTTGAMIPLLGARRSHGYMDLYWRRSHKLDPSERAFLALLSKIVSTAFDRAAGNEKIAQESAEAQLLMEIGKVAGSSLQIDTVYARFAELVGCVIPFDRISLSLVNSVTGMSRTAHNSGLDLGLVDPTEEHSAGGSISGEVARLRKAIVIDSRNQLEFAARLPRFRRYLEAGLVSTLSVPIIWQDRAIAVLTMRSLQKDFYGPEHISIASRIAALIAGAVANAEMHRTVDQLANERLLLAETGRAVNSAQSEKAAFLRITDVLGQMMPVDRIVLGMLDDDGSEIRKLFVSGIAVPERGEGATIDLADTGVRSALEMGLPMVMNPGSETARSLLRNAALDAFVAAGIQSVMHVPLIYGGQPQGVITISSTQQNVYGERELSLAGRLASLVSGFLANVRAKQTLQHMQRQLEFSDALAGQTPTNESGVEFVRRTEKVIASVARCDLFVYSELDHDSNELIVKFTGGISSQLAKLGAVVGAIGPNDEVDPGPEFLKRLSDAGARASHWNVVRSSGRVIGAAGIFSSHNRGFGISEKRAISRLTDRLGLIHERNVASAVSAPRSDMASSPTSDTWSTRDARSIASDGRVARLVIVDQHPACRGTIRVQLAGSHFQIVGECRSIEDAQGAADGACDLVIWGTHSGDSSAQLQSAVRVAHLYKVLVLTDRLSVDGLREVVRVGISGYISRLTSPAALQRDIQTLLEGGTTVDPSLLSVFFSKLPSSHLGLTAAEADLLAGLTDRDRLILREVANGRTNGDIARAMNLAVGSVKNRLVDIYRHIGATDRVEAAAFAIRAGLLK